MPASVLKLTAACLLPLLAGLAGGYGLVRYWPTDSESASAAPFQTSLIPAVPVATPEPELPSLKIPPDLNTWDSLRAAAAQLSQAERRAEIERLQKEDNNSTWSIRVIMDHFRVRHLQYRALLQPEDLPWIREEFMRYEGQRDDSGILLALSHAWAEWDAPGLEAWLRTTESTNRNYAAARENPEATWQKALQETRPNFDLVGVVLPVIADRNLLEALEAASSVSDDGERWGRLYNVYIGEAVARGEAEELCDFMFAGKNLAG